MIFVSIPPPSPSGSSEGSDKETEGEKKGTGFKYASASKKVNYDEEWDHTFTWSGIKRTQGISATPQGNVRLYAPKCYSVSIFHAEAFPRLRPGIPSSLPPYKETDWKRWFEIRSLYELKSNFLTNCYVSFWSGSSDSTVYASFKESFRDSIFSSRYKKVVNEDGSQILVHQENAKFKMYRHPPLRDSNFPRVGGDVAAKTFEEFKEVYYVRPLSVVFAYPPTILHYFGEKFLGPGFRAMGEMGRKEFWMGLDGGKDEEDQKKGMLRSYQDFAKLIIDGEAFKVTRDYFVKLRKDISETNELRFKEAKRKEEAEKIGEDMKKILEHNRRLDEEERKRSKGDGSK